MNPNIKITLQIWLTWVFTKALGICGAGLAAIGITTTHDTPQLMAGVMLTAMQMALSWWNTRRALQATPQLMAGVMLTAMQMALSWWNTRRALQATPPTPATFTSMPLHVVVAALALTVFGLSACSTTASSSTSGTASASTSFIEAELPVIRVGASVATGAVLDFAVSQSSTRTRLANEMYSAANAVYSLSGGSFPTTAQFQSSILAFGGTQADAGYAQFAAAISSLYAAYYPKIVTGDTKTITDLMNAIAGGIEDATQAYVTTPVVAAKKT